VPTPLTARLSNPLFGSLAVPGDKSISHRALMLGAIAVGETVIDGLLEGEDVRATAAALRAMGAEIETKDGRWHVWGRGVGGLAEPAQVLDMGNSGTAARLLLGLLATHGLTATLTGDASLVQRPMGRVIEPLMRMGATFTSRDGKLPVTVQGAGVSAAGPIPIAYTPPVASAQVKSAILLAGLNTPGETSVLEPRPTRDHTERMLRHFGAAIRIEDSAEGRRATLSGEPELTGRTVTVPGDPSSAAFPLVAALLVPGSAVTVTGVGLNPLRAGLFDALRDMGADLTVANEREIAGEPVGDLTARHGPLTGITVPAERAPSMIDEYPVLAMAAACAKGVTRFEGVGELRVKESDRIDAVAAGLRMCGVDVETGPDWMVVHGLGGPPPGPPADQEKDGAAIETHLDHRIAMSFLVLGLAAKRPVTVDDAAPIETSFPHFADLMRGLGASL
jgi:3-phosphoshikimate 1-carboxyvinyltransferase